MSDKKNKEIKYIVKIGEIEFVFDHSSTATNFAALAKNYMVTKDKKVSINLE